MAWLFDRRIRSPAPPEEKVQPPGKQEREAKQQAATDEDDPFHAFGRDDPPPALRRGQRVVDASICCQPSTQTVGFKGAGRRFSMKAVRWPCS